MRSEAERKSDHDYYISHKERHLENGRRWERKNPLHRVFVNMMLRCGHWKGGNKRNVEDYAKRGIAVCQEWREYETFKQWAMENGWRKGLVIDRINNNEGYSPSNCRFITQKENLLNRRNTVYVVYAGKQQRLHDIWEHSERIVSYPIFLTRIRRQKWEIEKALTQPIMNKIDNLRRIKK